MEAIPNFQQFLKQHKIRRTEKDKPKALRLLKKAQEDLQAANDMLSAERNGWALSIAYNSMLSCALALMAKAGFWPNSDSHHLAAVAYCSHIFGAQASDLVILFNRYRIKRHDSIYGEELEVSQTEAQNSINYAKEFLELAKK
ncbi:MAG: HEPN domain-containing protein, partial [Candidatus Micrarchaeota archaeon]